jgi:hypothetical protein
MRPVEFQDSFFKLPVNERIQQQQQQQPSTNQELHQKIMAQQSNAKMESPQPREETQNVITERQKRDREFRNKKKQQRDNKKKLPSGDGLSSLLDIKG